LRVHRQHRRLGENQRWLLVPHTGLPQGGSLAP
jgi:hypothetical protein